MKVVYGLLTVWADFCKHGCLHIYIYIYIRVSFCSLLYSNDSKLWYGGCLMPPLFPDSLHAGFTSTVAILHRLFQLLRDAFLTLKFPKPNRPNHLWVLHSLTAFSRIHFKKISFLFTVFLVKKHYIAYFFDISHIFKSI